MCLVTERDTVQHTASNKTYKRTAASRASAGEQVPIQALTATTTARQREQLARELKLHNPVLIQGRSLPGCGAAE